jgi:hypothetical protein
MPRSQLAINCPQGLLERLRGEAQQQRTTVTALVLAWLEAGLDGRLDAPRTASSSELEQRLDIVEQRVGALEQGQPTKAQPVPKPAAAAEPLAGAITTAELAERTGTNRAAWNNWANDQRIGQTRPHPEAGPWRLVGKGPGPNGGPDRWLWEAV